eukprot:TRINITY_DN43358_c0_g1_i1.p1 TRINITY_DN43358_c0_g1~~TRINITY_DN43358_c0_g1_i1.p1  ORF type:complete len:199 (+),score=23.39 TRINITY_DN43358_c0_g1_i1:55-597(+)
MPASRDALLALCMVLNAPVAAGRIINRGKIDGDFCWDPDKGQTVRTSDCPHGCCVDNDCGSKNQCKAVYAIGLIVLIASCVCVCSLVVLAVLWWRHMFCFSKAERSDTSMLPPAARPQQHNPQDNLYPYAHQNPLPPPGPVYNYGNFAPHPVPIAGQPVPPIVTGQPVPVPPVKEGEYYH